jgi:hypothetical protein
MMNESTIVVMVCVSFVKVIPKLSGRMDFMPLLAPACRDLAI